MTDPLAGVDDGLCHIHFLNGKVEEISDQAHVLCNLGISQFQHLHAVTQAGHVAGLIAVAGLDEHVCAVLDAGTQLIDDGNIQLLLVLGHLLIRLKQRQRILGTVLIFHLGNGTDLIGDLDGSLVSFQCLGTDFGIFIHQTAVEAGSEHELTGLHTGLFLQLEHLVQQLIAPVGSVHENSHAVIAQLAQDVRLLCQRIAGYHIGSAGKLNVHRYFLFYVSLN